jgi:hypothetical protein
MSRYHLPGITLTRRHIATGNGFGRSVLSCAGSKQLLNTPLTGSARLRFNYDVN